MSLASKSKSSSTAEEQNNRLSQPSTSSTVPAAISGDQLGGNLNSNWWHQQQQIDQKAMVVQLSGANFQHHHHHNEHHSAGSHHQLQSNILVDANSGNGMSGGAIDNSPGSSTASNADMSGGGANGDAEGVWSPDIDQAFHEALQIYPPCGRRKIILSDEGKMYGRNELIARYIKIRCGKTRTRKQVSSHIQVLARKKQREVHSKVKVQDSKYGGDYDCDGGDLGGEFGAQLGQMQKMSPGGSSPASSSCLDISATSSSSIGISGAQNGSNNAAKNMPNQVLIQAKDAAISGNGLRLNGTLKLEMPSAADVAQLTSSTSNRGGTLNDTDASISTNQMNTSGSNASVANAAAASAALAAVAAAGIQPQSAAGAAPWPYGMNAAMFNNYYTASMMNDENIYQQFAAAALAAGVSLPNAAAALSASSTATAVAPTALISSTTTDFLQQLQLQQQLQQQQYLGTELLPSTSSVPSLAECTISSSKLILCGFTAYIEQANEQRVDLVKIPKVSDDPLETIKLEDIQSKYPPLLQQLFEEGPSDAFFLVKCWANVSFDIADERSALYSVDSFYNTRENFDISVSTKVCSFGKQVVEKVEVYSPVCDEADNNLYQFQLEKSPMCDYMVRFIAELKKLGAHPLMNSVLDNFTVLQIVTNKSTNETLMVIAFIFEVSPEPESTCRIYRLVA